jgi:hypothetical protein
MGLPFTLSLSPLGPITERHAGCWAGERPASLSLLYLYMSLLGTDGEGSPFFCTSSWIVGWVGLGTDCFLAAPGSPSLRDSLGPHPCS